MGEGERPDRSGSGRHVERKAPEGRGSHVQEGASISPDVRRAGVIDSAVQVGTDSDSCTGVTYVGAAHGSVGQAEGTSDGVASS